MSASLGWLGTNRFSIDMIGFVLVVLCRSLHILPSSDDIIRSSRLLAILLYTRVFDFSIFHSVTYMR